MNGCIISDLKINIEHQSAYLDEKVSGFTSAVHARPDILVQLIKADELRMPEGALVIEDRSVTWLAKTNPASGYYIIQRDETSHRILVLMDTDAEWKNIRLVYLDLEVWLSAPAKGTERKNIPLIEYYTFCLLGIAFRNHIVQRNGLVIHASSISCGNFGILFTAPSGTGKSTHAGLWEKYFGSRVSVLNDDTPALRLLEGIPYLCGTPWSGSSDKYTNSMVPLKAAVVLEQAPENTIRPLSSGEALPMILPRIFLPYYDEALMGKAYDTLEKILGAVPFYHLMCRPDKEAIGLVYQCVV